MPADEFLYELFKNNPPKTIINKERITKIVNLKKKIFKEIENITLIDGAKELLEDLNKTSCIKAIVSGASRKEDQYIIEKKIGSRNFDLIITGDDAYHADIRYIITLNNTPLTISDFYNFLPRPINNEFEKYIFKDSILTKGFILDWIYK